MGLRHLRDDENSEELYGNNSDGPDSRSVTCVCLYFYIMVVAANLRPREQHLLVVRGAGRALSLRGARDVDGLRAEASTARRAPRLAAAVTHHRIRTGTCSDVTRGRK